MIYDGNNKVIEGHTCCEECFIPSHDVARGHVLVAMPENCKDIECQCHQTKKGPLPELDGPKNLFKAIAGN